MRASFLGLEIQKRSVQMAQKALDVTGNNLSNRDTVGYTRQRLDVYSSYMNMNGIYTTKLARLGMYFNLLPVDFTTFCHGTKFE